MAHVTRKSTDPATDLLSRVPELPLLAQSLRLAARQLEERDTWGTQKARLIEEQAWLRAMIDQVPDYLFVKDQQGRFIIANKAVASDLGRTPESIIGLTDIDLHSPSRS